MSHYDLAQLVESARTVRRGTIQVAEDIPEAGYGFRPAPGSRSVAETLVHIAWLTSADLLIHEEQHMASFDGFDFGAFLDSSEAEETKPRTKAEIIELLRSEGERWATWAERKPDTFLAERFGFPNGKSSSRFVLLMGTKEHEMTHRAQLTVMQRMLGVVPHFTRNLPPSSRSKAA